MTIEKLREFYDASPFQPFVLHLADGRKIPVVHRDFFAAAPSGRTVKPRRNGKGRRRRRA
jgi:hypothetical protein